MSEIRLALLCLVVFLVTLPIFAQSAQLSFVQASPSVAGPSGRIDFTLRIANTGSNIWYPSDPALFTCREMVHIGIPGTEYPDPCPPTSPAPGGIIIIIQAFKLDSPNFPYADYWSRGINLPQVVGPSESIQVSDYIIVSTEPGPYSLVAYMGITGCCGFTSRIMNNQAEAYNMSPHFDFRVAIDTTPPSLLFNGRLGGACVLWPPNNKLVHVGDITALDNHSSVATFTVSVTSDDPTTSPMDVVISGSGTGPRSIQLRAVRAGNVPARIYTIDASVVDGAGNMAASKLQCTVPHDQGH